MNKLPWLSYLNTICINIISKRTWVFVIASIALWDSLITSPEWAVITGIYLADKVAGNLIHKRTETKED